MRIYSGVAALVGWFALALQLYLILVQSPARGVAMVGTVITYFSFFTILTNILVALVLTAAASGLGGGWAQRVASPSSEAATAVYITVVGLAYQLLLRKLWNPQGAQWLADVLLHSVMPLGYVVYWLFLAPRTRLRWKDVWGWLVYPAVYLVYILARGAVSGVYPYPFVDVNLSGYRGVLVNTLVFTSVFVGLGLLAVAFTRRTAKSI
jgi:hypothetical protein